MKKAEVPKLKNRQCSVIFAEVNTGIVLTPAGERHVGQAECYSIFNSVEEALAFAQTYVERHPTVECSIYDENGTHLKLIKATD
jgi:hypothetical protein